MQYLQERDENSSFALQDQIKFLKSIPTRLLQFSQSYLIPLPEIPFLDGYTRFSVIQRHLPQLSEFLIFHSKGRKTRTLMCFDYILEIAVSVQFFSEIVTSREFLFLCFLVSSYCLLSPQPSCYFLSFSFCYLFTPCFRDRDYLMF